MAVVATDRHLVVTVADDGDATVAIRQSGTGPGGYGMQLVETLSAGWEQLQTTRGTTVRFWMELPHDHRQ